MIHHGIYSFNLSVIFDIIDYNIYPLIANLHHIIMKTLLIRLIVQNFPISELNFRNHNSVKILNNQTKSEPGLIYKKTTSK